MNGLPALNGISCLWKIEGMEIPRHLSIIADLQYVLYKIICHYCFPQQTNKSFPGGRENKQTNKQINKYIYIYKLQRKYYLEIKMISKI